MMSISLNTSSVVFRIPFGLGSAVSTRVSTNLGAGKQDAACLAVKVVMFLAITEGITISLIAVAVRNIWGFLYSNDVEVVRYLAIIMPVLAVSNFMDGIQAVLSGTARGCGWQKLGAYANLGAYFLVVRSWVLLNNLDDKSNGPPHMSRAFIAQKIEGRVQQVKEELHQEYEKKLEEKEGVMKKKMRKYDEKLNLLMVKLGDVITSSDDECD